VPSEQRTRRASASTASTLARRCSAPKLAHTSSSATCAAWPAENGTATDIARTT
jgi:hypothetical protein